MDHHAGCTVRWPRQLLGASREHHGRGSLCSLCSVYALGCDQVVFVVCDQVYGEFLRDFVFPKLQRPSVILNDNLSAHFTGVSGSFMLFVWCCLLSVLCSAVCDG